MDLGFRMSGLGPVILYKSVKLTIIIYKVGIIYLFHGTVVLVKQINICELLNIINALY